MNKDSPSSRKMKSLFFRSLANFGNVSPFLAGATNIFSQLIHPLLKLNCVLKQHPHILHLSEALSSFNFLPLQGAGTGFVCITRTILLQNQSPSVSSLQRGWSCEQIFDSSTTFMNPLVKMYSLYGRRIVSFFLSPHMTLRAFEACTFRHVRVLS